MTKQKLINPISILDDTIIIDIPKCKALKYMESPELVHIEGTNKTGWITELRINNPDVYDDIKVVQLRHSDNDLGIPISIEEHVLVNRYGDMIISQDTYDEIINPTGYWYVPADYIDNEDELTQSVISYINEGEYEYVDTSANL